MGADNHPTVVPENFVDSEESTLNDSSEKNRKFEDDGNDDMYSIGEAVRYVEEAAPEDAQNVRATGGALAFEWAGMNRIGLWTHLLEHGWVTTSMANGHVYFERLDRID